MRVDKKFPFKEEIIKRFEKWTGIPMSNDIEEALVELTGDTFFEVRKLISVLLTHVEDLVKDGKYAGYEEGNKLTEEQKKCIKEQREDLKDFLRETVEDFWRGILKKQKIGIDKLGLCLREYINDENINLSEKPGE